MSSRCDVRAASSRASRRHPRRQRTSGSYSYTLGHDIAVALLQVDLGVPGTELEVPILGETRKARVIAESPYDPEASRCRM